MAKITESGFFATSFCERELCVGNKKRPPIREAAHQKPLESYKESKRKDDGGV
jgi:hypothetical protein